MIPGGPLTLSFICLERYIAVVHPTFYPLLKKYRCREGCALSMWFLVLPTATIKYFLIEFKINNQIVIDYMVYTVMFLMLIVIAWCSHAILKALRTSGPATDKLHPAKKRAFQTVRAIAIIASMCYIPVGGLISYTIIKGNETICSTIPAILFLVTIASVAHPIFYLSTTGNLPCLIITDSIRNWRHVAQVVERVG
ncbi:unnamed protein product [Gadus morhua 'NCC']